MGPVAHMNLARLLHPAGDSRVAEFVDAIDAVNAIAERSPGFIWRLTSPVTRTDASGTFEAIDADDPLIASSVSVWEEPDSLRFFVQKTLHGTFLRKRAAWFQPLSGPVYVIWPVTRDAQPTMAEAKVKLAELAANGASAAAYDFKWLDAQRAGS
jgi:hypothetical protein